MFKTIILFACLMLPCMSAAKDIVVYKCIINNVATFSQTPCNKDPQQIILRNVDVTKGIGEVTTHSKITDTAVADYLQVQQIDRKIKQLKLKIKQYEREYTQKKQQIDYITQDKANRLGANSIADAITTQTANLKQTYESYILQANLQIDALTIQKQQLSTMP